MSWRLPSAWTAITPDQAAATSGNSRAGPTAMSVATFDSGEPDAVGFPSGSAGSELEAAGDAVATVGAPRRQDRTEATHPAASHVPAIL